MGGPIGHITTTTHHYHGQDIHVGTSAGTLYTLRDSSMVFWNAMAADPDSSLHTTDPNLGPWYGGCSVSCPQGRCPVNCSNSSGGVWMSTRSFGSPIRKVFGF
jgi:hypothetical protein